MPGGRRWKQALILLASGLWAGGVSAAICPGAPGSIASAEQARYLEQQVHQIGRAASLARSEIAFEEFRVEDLHATLAGDASAMYAWVRDETRWLPYAGALRGADGVMHDRMGSSLDRALLLAELLERSRYTVRLAHAPLDPVALDAMRGHWSGVPLATRPGVELNPAEAAATVADVAARHQLPAAELEQVYQAGTEQADSTRERLVRNTLRQQQALLGELDATPGSGVHEAPPAHHWWVQLQTRDGWQALDPALPSLAEGERLLAGEPRAVHFPEELPDAFRHWLTIAVVAEQLIDGSLKEHVALEHRMASMDLVGQQILINTHPMNLPSLNALLGNTPGFDRNDLPQAVLGETRWMPFLNFGETLHSDDLMILADGSLNAVEKSLTGEAFSTAVGALGQIRRGRSGGDTRDALPPELTAVVVRMQVDAPQRETDRFERPLMDILGPGQRAAGVADVEIDDSMRERRAVALLGSLELVPQVAWIHPGQQSAWGYETLMDNRQSLLGTAHALSRDDFQFIGDAIEAGSQRQDALDQLAMLRLVYSPHLEDIALNRINLLGYVRLLGYDDGEPGTRQGFDIIDNRVDAPWRDDAPQVRLAQGILETLLEADLLAGSRLAAGNASLNNAALAYRNDLQTGSLWKPLRQGDAMGKTQGFGWRPDADMRAHFAAELSAGKHLIVPTTLAARAHGPTWWQLDPVTGDIVGFGPDRRGQFVEAILMLMNSINNALSAVQMVQSIWECLFFDDPACCTKQVAANAGANKVLSGYFASAAKVSNVNFVIGRDIVHGKLFAQLNEMAIGAAAGRVAGQFTNRTPDC